MIGAVPLLVVNVAAAAQSISPDTFMSEVRPKLIATNRKIEQAYRAGQGSVSSG